MSYVINPPIERPTRSRTGRRVATFALTFCLTLAVLGLLGSFKSLGATDPATPNAAATPTSSCVFQGTPEASTEAPTSMVSVCAPGELGKPVMVNGLSVTMTLTSEKAGPQTVTIAIADASGNPVDDATVKLVNRHLEMNMGDFPHDLEMTAPGIYSGEQVGMGMGGRWQTLIEITRPGQDTVTVVFEEALQGLK